MRIRRAVCGLFIFSTLFLSGCWSAHELNTLAISVCIGIDKTEEGYMITEQIVNPKVVGSKEASSEATVVIYSAEGKNIEETFGSFASQMSRSLYNSHLRIVVFSEEVAKEGIKDLVEYFIRGNEFRSDFYFLIAKGYTAREILSFLTPLESIPGMELFNKLTVSSEEWAPTKDTRIIELVNCIISDGNNPVISGVGLTEDEEAEPKSTEDLKKTNIKKLVYTSLGAFSEDKLVGWLDVEESKGYNYITDNVESTVGYANHGEDVEIAFEVSNSGSKIKPSLKDGKPEIEVEINLEYSITAIKGEFDITKRENFETADRIAEEKVKSICEDSVAKAQKELKTDFFGFGDKFRQKYPDYWKTVKDKWNEEFPKLKVNISVKGEIKTLGEISKSYFEKEE